MREKIRFEHLGFLATKGKNAGGRSSKPASSQICGVPRDRGARARRTESVAGDHHAALVLAPDDGRAGDVRGPAGDARRGAGWGEDRATTSVLVGSGRRARFESRHGARTPRRTDARGWGRRGGGRLGTARGIAREFKRRAGDALRVRDRTGRDAERATDAVRPDVRGRALDVGVLRVVRGIHARGHHAGADDRVVAHARGDHLRVGEV